jgi:hydrogenase maturation protease
MNEWEWNLLEDKASLDHVEIGGVMVRTGDRVRLRPKGGGDILDIALRGQVATIESIEEDYEGGQHICVVLDDDPGRDLGMMRQPGHRFFFAAEEVEPIAHESGSDSTADARARSQKPRVLVAGIGNIFLGDDGFGVEVVRRLLTRPRSDAVRVVDFGIRGLDLTYALQDGFETTILVDAYPHGQSPGTVSIVEPDLKDLSVSGGDFVQPHAMHPMNVLRMAAAMNGPLTRVLLVGCEPGDLGGDEGHMGLSEAVEAAVGEAVNRIEVLVNQILDERKI